MADSTLPLGGAIDVTPRGETYHTWLDVVQDWVTTVDHKKIGLMYIAYALLFLLVGGVEAMLIRIQLAVPHNDFLSPEVYQPHLHHARHHHGVSRGHAADRRIRQLPHPADDRRARHGVPALECFSASG